MCAPSTCARVAASNKHQAPSPTHKRPTPYPPLLARDFVLLLFTTHRAPPPRTCAAQLGACDITNATVARPEAMGVVGGLFSLHHHLLRHNSRLISLSFSLPVSCPSLSHHDAQPLRLKPSLIRINPHLVAVPRGCLEDTAPLLLPRTVEIFIFWLSACSLSKREADPFDLFILPLIGGWFGGFIEVF